jgi:hypothetical protein
LFSYQDHLLGDMCPIDLTMTVLLEVSVVYECEKFPILLVVDAEHQGVVGVVDLEQFVALQVLLLKLDLFKGNVLIHAGFDPHILNVVVLVRSVHHRRHVVHIALLSDAGVHPQVNVTEGINLARQLELSIGCELLMHGVMMISEFLQS